MDSFVFSVLHNYSSIVNYIGAVLLFLLCYAVNSFSIVDFKINKYTLYIVKTFYSILLFLLGLPALFYLAYVKLYGKGINDIVVLTVLQTTCSEVKSYLLNTFSIAQLVIIGASLILLLAIIIFSVNQLTTPEKWKANFINRKIKCYYSSIVILIIVISGFLLYRHHFYIFPFDRYYSINASDSGLLKIFNDFNKIKLERNKYNNKIYNNQKIIGLNPKQRLNQNIQDNLDYLNNFEKNLKK